MKTKYFLNGNKVNPPLEHLQLRFEINWDKDNIDLHTGRVKGQLSTQKLRWTGKEAKLHFDWCFDEKILKTGSAVVGLPFQYKIGDKRNAIPEVTLFDGYSDLMEQTEFNCNDMQVTIKEKNLDWINDVSDGVSFELIYQNKIFLEEDVIFVAYCKEPKTFELIMTFISLICLLYSLISEIINIQGIIAECSNPFQAASIISLTFHFIYLTILIASLISNLITLIDMIIQPIKYHSAIPIRTLFKRGCEKFGLIFSTIASDGSDIFAPSSNEYNWALMPEKSELAEFEVEAKGISQIAGLVGINTKDFKFKQRGYKAINALLQKGFANMTFGEFMRTFKEVFNARIVIQNNVFHFIRWDKNPKGFNLSKAFKIKDIVADNMVETFSVNMEDYRSNILIEFQTDLSDELTIKHYRGTGLQVFIQPKSGVIRLTKGLERHTFPFALAKRKVDLNLGEDLMQVFSVIIDGFVAFIEGIINAAIFIINGVIALYNAIISFLDTVAGFISAGALDFGGLQINQIEEQHFSRLGDKIKNNRIGAMLLEKDEFETPKLMQVVPHDGKIYHLSAANKNTVTAKYLWDNYLFINTFAPLLVENGVTRIDIDNGLHNQWERRVREKHPMTYDNFLQLKNNNSCNAPSRLNTNEDSVILNSAKFNPYNCKADIDYSINKLNRKLAKNLILTQIEPDGN